MLPTIAPYELPSAHEVPQTRVNWDFDPSRSALLIHDMQQYFVDAYGENSRLITQVTSNIRDLREAAPQANIPVFFTAQPPEQDPKDRGLLWDFWGPGMQDDGSNKVIHDLSPREGDQVLTKWRYDAFSRSDFEEQLASLGRDQLIITGVYAHIGCLTTATSAFMRDIKPFLVADALADFSRDEHLWTLRYAASRCGVVTDTQSMLNSIESDLVKGGN
ncbi:MULTISPECIES: isochorismatase family protein [Corynebacterium]|uniref:isochorismatase family protein n=1 Tax=Corynebacterium TaxID=1716 RepID=UPI000EBF5BED|nr:MULTISPECIES: isochorismatase family protein [Corynebacterium]MDN6136508.1 isochorismatase family protein [Corynebacterium sp.]MDN6382468.1 isochorismatase family protein [Corynebacterium casei]MDN6694025.1 isochorismatase family protein [Corynebacterium casei]MDN6737474.1 isochorismatase family protein [Corynebacterium sp.]HCJ69301.1 2,3-dihydro-2,3-dihydroxybenzoate synthetase [Corynebacterium casei]